MHISTGLSVAIVGDLNRSAGFIAHYRFQFNRGFPGRFGSGHKRLGGESSAAEMGIDPAGNSKRNFRRSCEMKIKTIRHIALARLVLMGLYAADAQPVADKSETCSVLKPSVGDNCGWQLGDLKESGLKTREFLIRLNGANASEGR